MPPHEPVYQYQLPPIPRAPALMLKVDELPRQIIDGEEDAEGGDELVVFTTILTLKQRVVLQVFSPLTQYVIVPTGVTIGLEPETIYVPPHEPLYQYQLPPIPSDPPVTEIFDEFPKHIVDGNELVPVGSIETV